MALIVTVWTSVILFAVLYKPPTLSSLKRKHRQMGAKQQQTGAARTVANAAPPGVRKRNPVSQGVQQQGPRHDRKGSEPCSDTSVVLGRATATCSPRDACTSPEQAHQGILSCCRLQSTRISSPPARHRISTGEGTPSHSQQ
eukprot:scaffold215_cov423-Prasinococcus_capsulatus_cf.AAC.10